jgi:hypothetical protein
MFQSFDKSINFLSSKIAILSKKKMIIELATDILVGLYWICAAIHVKVTK